MLALTLLVLTAYAATNCCGDKDLVNDAKYTMCTIPKPTAGCPAPYVEDADDDTKCKTNDILKTDCKVDDDLNVETLDKKCEDIVGDYDAAKCTDPGMEGIGITSTGELEVIGCCGALPEKKLGKCLCGEGLLDTYKMVTYDGTEQYCVDLETMLDADLMCDSASLRKDLADLGCCKAAKTDKGADNPKDKVLADLKTGEVAVVMKDYAEAKCETLLKEEATVYDLDTCVESEDGDLAVGFKKLEKNAACDTFTVTFYTDEECQTAAKDADDKDVKQEIKPKCENGLNMELVCEAVTAGSNASVLSALVIMLAAALRY